LPVQAADAAYRGGRGSQADVFAARAAAAQIDDRIAAADREVAGARTMLTRWTGVATDEVLGAPPALDAVWLNEETLNQTLRTTPNWRCW
jgi:outer membrane protein TolC